MRIRILLFFLIILFVNKGFSQSNSNDDPWATPDTAKIDLRGWSIGGSVSSYFGNKFTANYYNGSRVEYSMYGMDSTNVGRVLDNPFNQKQIKEALGYNYRLGEYPQDMRYKPALMYGFFAKYMVNNNLGVVLQFNHVKLVASDVLTLELDQYNSGFSSPVYYQAAIYGAEERNHFSLGITYSFVKEIKPRSIFPFVEGGFDMNNTKVTEAGIQIGNLNYSIINPYNVMYHVKEGGIGFGGFGGGGVEFFFNRKFSFSMGTDMYYTRIKLGTPVEFKLQPTAFFKINMRGF